MLKEFTAGKKSYLIIINMQILTVVLQVSLIIFKHIKSIANLNYYDIRKRQFNWSVRYMD